MCACVVRSAWCVVRARLFGTTAKESCCQCYIQHVLSDVSPNYGVFGVYLSLQFTVLT